MLSGHKDVERERATERGNKYKRIMTTTTSAAAATRREEDRRSVSFKHLHVIFKNSQEIQRAPQI